MALIHTVYVMLWSASAIVNWQRLSNFLCTVCRTYPKNFCHFGTKPNFTCTFLCFCRFHLLL